MLTNVGVTRTDNSHSVVSLGITKREGGKKERYKSAWDGEAVREGIKYCTHSKLKFLCSCIFALEEALKTQGGSRGIALLLFYV